jgi:tRNA dimethylallyltransferase
VSATFVAAKPIPAILLMGPTAAGKSALALSLAERFAGEIVSVDSAQVFRGMDIGTAKPDAHARSRVPHHLLDLIDPTEAYSAARFRADALAAIAQIRARGRVPILCGGTMLYFRALTEGLSELPSANPRVRAELDARAAREGWAALHAELAMVDPATAARLQPGDTQRIQRALEVWRIAGVPLSQLQGRRTRTVLELEPGIRIALVPSDRARLHRAIAQRFDAMLSGGLVDELRGLRRRYALTPGLPSMRSVGYRQAWSYLDGAFDEPTLRARGIAATRQLAKRQFTWLRSMELTSFDPYAADAADAMESLVATAVA